MNKKVTITAGISAVAAIIMIVCVKVLVPVCTGMVETAAGKQIPMKCHYTSQAIVIIGVLLLVNAIVCIITKQGVACGIMSVVLSLAVIALFSDSIGIGICVKPEMACHQTAPIMKVCATVTAIIGVVMAVLGKKES